MNTDVGYTKRTAILKEKNRRMDEVEVGFIEKGVKK